MRQSPPENDLSKLEQELSPIFLDASAKLIRHKDEIINICYASPFIKRVCLSQPEWLEKLFKGELQQDYSIHEYRTSY